MIESAPATMPETKPVTSGNRKISIGFPASASPSERRFPITPEGAETLVEQGFEIKIEQNAGAAIHYTDANYSRRGAEITTRGGALACDIIVHPAPLREEDIPSLRRGSMLLTMLNLEEMTSSYIAGLNRKSIIAIALDRITDSAGNRPFADILNEVAGRAAIALAGSHLCDSINGKGILLGGIAGIVPCEVTVIGSGIAAIAAATSACGLGATVRMFDDDIYSLRRAALQLGPQIIASSQHHSVLSKALFSADVIILTEVSRKPLITAEETSLLKRGVITFDLTENPGKSFVAMETRNAGTCSLATINSSRRICYTHASNAVPRTAAMAMSNTLVTLFGSLRTSDCATNALKLSEGLQEGAITYLGKIVSAEVAARLGCRAQDISLFIRLS